MAVQFILGSWMESFFLLLILVMLTGVQHDKQNELTKQVDIPMTKELLIYYTLSFFYNLYYLVSVYCTGKTDPGFVVFMRISMFCYYAFGAAQTVFLLQIVRDHVAVKLGKKGLEKLIRGGQLLQIPSVLLLILTPLTGVIYGFSDANEYVRMWGYYYWQAVTVATFLLIGAVILWQWRNIARFPKIILSVATVLPMVGFIANILLGSQEGSMVYTTILVLNAMLLFVCYEKNKTLIITQYANELEQTRHALMENRLTLLMAQIKPHFINNAITAVQELCYEDPERAADLIGHFARYLRNNLEAISGETTIPLEDEIKAIEEYLALEYADSAKKFSFIFDLKCRDFRVPPLSIEPLAENAVKHGIDRYSADAKVILSTFETEDAYCAEIRDNGAGFDRNEETLGKGGIGLENVLSRLKLLCSGELTAARTDGWTVVTIRIPKA